jgi:hypothetical protein
MRRNLDWQQLKDRTFHTATGKRFAVVNVTAKNVIIRPAGGVRNYDLSIPNELERGLSAYEAGRFFPSPSDWLRIGVRAVRSSYVWGILYALLIQEATSVPPITTSARNLVGRWRIIQLSELGEDYFNESDEPPLISIHLNKYGTLRGEYHFGLSDGNFDGEIREFGGETVLLFGYEGSDEMDEVHGAGWVQLRERDRLEGEFVVDYGRFVATREHGTSNRPRSKRSTRK